MSFYQRINFPIIIPALFIASLSIVSLFSLSEKYSKLQLVYTFIGLVLFFLITYLNLRFLKIYWKHLYFLGLSLLIITLFVGTEVKGSIRWLSFGAFNFQPSEFIKVIAVLSLSGFLSSIKDGVKSLYRVIKLFLLTILICTLVFIQPDLGTAVVIFVIFLVLLTQIKMNLVYIIISFLVLGLFSQPLWNSLRDYQKERILVFFNSNRDPSGSGYNVLQSKIAVGSGKVFGRGFGYGTQSKLKFLPEFHTDLDRKSVV